MTERKNLSVIIAAQAVVVLPEQRVSLVARGLAALQESKNHELVRNNQDETYRQARTIFEVPCVRKWHFENEKSDLFSAFKIFQQLANENYGKAYYPLSCCYSSLAFHCVEDAEKNEQLSRHFGQLALDWCNANHGIQDAELWCDLGEMVADENVEQAVHWIRKAAEQGYARAQYCLGDIYGYDYDDYKIAAEWYRKAADQGYAEAQWHLARMYRDGQGVPQNDELAVYWSRKAAEQGFFAAQCSLGWQYKSGTGIPKNDKLAAEWYGKAAIQGSQIGASVLAGMYKEGLGVEQSDEQAAYWYRKAAEWGSTHAQEAL